MLPKIVWGNQEFWDISGIVRPNRFVRPGTDGLAIHHTVGQTEFPDRNANSTNMDEQIAHIKAIDTQHVNQGYGGFGYNAIVFRDGAVYTVGRMEGARAHVAHQNGHLGGVAWAGDSSANPIPMGALLGLGRVAAAMESEYGVTVMKPHRDWVAPEHKPQWATACCGDRGAQQMGQIMAARDAIIRKSTANDAEVRRIIADAIREAALNGDLEKLAAQINYITGGTLC